MPVLKHFPVVRFLIVMIALTLLAGCAGQPPTGVAKAAPESDALLRLAPGDKIDLVVYGEETVSGTYMLDEDGNINIPLAGKIKAGGLTKSALQDTISNILVKGGFQQEPYVTVEINAMRPFFINGEVGHPGSYPYQPSLDVFQAVAIAGGYSPRASMDKIVITRTRGTEKTRFYATEDTPIWPGDFYYDLSAPFLRAIRNTLT